MKHCDTVQCIILISCWYIMLIYHAVCIFFAGRRSNLLQDEAYAQQFDSAAGSHTGAQGPSSVRVYSHSDRDRLYEAWRIGKAWDLGGITDQWYLYNICIFNSYILFIYDSYIIQVVFMYYSCIIHEASSAKNEGAPMDPLIVTSCPGGSPWLPWLIGDVLTQP